jgi:hypothetical protein
MAIRVVGAGLGRTGTLSLKVALEKLLGGKCYHMAEVVEHPEHMPVSKSAALGDPVDFKQLLDGYVAAVDWPASAFWQPISREFPDAIILLSSRDASSWWESASTTIFPTASKAEGPWREMLDAMFGTFTRDLTDREACIAAFERHNANVRKTADPKRLVDWTPKDGWEPICRALGVAVPDEPFPRVNTKEEFASRWNH